LRERVHVPGFICEKTFEPGEIARKTAYMVNPTLASDNAIKEAILSWPLRRG
jgi:hypothetical protein